MLDARFRDALPHIRLEQKEKVESQENDED